MVARIDHGTDPRQGSDRAAFTECFFLPGAAVAAISGAVVGLLLLVANRYGWHRDELHFLEAGRHHLQRGYIDQPPFTPFIARLADAVAADNLVVLRLLPALSAAVAIHLGAPLVRELGGSARAQVVGAAAVAGGFTLGVSHLLSTATFDFTAWLGLLWITARLLRTDEPRWWLAFGGLAGLAMLNKNLVPLLAASVLVGMVVETPVAARVHPVVGRRRRPRPGAGVAQPALAGRQQLAPVRDGRGPRRPDRRREPGDPGALQLVFLGPPMVVAPWSSGRGRCCGTRCCGRGAPCCGRGRSPWSSPSPPAAGPTTRCR